MAATTPGVSTSEFRITAIFSAILALFSAFKPEAISHEMAAQLVAAVVSVYSISRGIVKGFAKPTP